MGTGATLFTDEAVVADIRHVDFGSSDSLNFSTTGISWVSAWVLPIGSVNSATILSRRRVAGAGVDDRFFLGTYTSDRLQFFFIDTTNSLRAINTGVALTLGVWQHVLGYLDKSADVMGCYIDGVAVGTPVATTGWTPKTTTVATSLLAGKNAPNYGNPWSGLMAHCMFGKDGSDSIATIASGLYTNGPGSVPATYGLTHHWPMGDDLTDQVGSLDGTAYNKPFVSVQREASDGSYIEDWMQVSAGGGSGGVDPLRGGLIV